MKLLEFNIVRFLLISLFAVQLCSCGPLMYPQTWSRINEERDQVKNAEHDGPESMYTIVEKLNRPFNELLPFSNVQYVVDARWDSIKKHRTMVYEMLVRKSTENDPYALMLLSKICRDEEGGLYPYCGEGGMYNMRTGLDYGWNSINNGIEFKESSSFDYMLLYQLHKDYTKNEEYDRAIHTLRMLQGHLTPNNMKEATMNLTETMLASGQDLSVWSELAFVKDPKLKTAVFQSVILKAIHSDNYDYAVKLLQENQDSISQNEFAAIADQLGRGLLSDGGYDQAFVAMHKFDSPKIRTLLLEVFVSELVKAKEPEIKELNANLPRYKKDLNETIVSKLILNKKSIDPEYSSLLSEVVVPWIKDGNSDSKVAAVVLPELVAQGQSELAEELYQSQPRTNPDKFKYFALYCGQEGNYAQALEWEEKLLQHIGKQTSKEAAMYAINSGEYEKAAKYVATLDGQDKVSCGKLLNSAMLITELKKYKDLPAEKRMKKYLSGAKNAYAVKDYETANLYFEALTELGIPMPNAFNYYYASSLNNTGKKFQARKLLVVFMSRSEDSNTKVYKKAMELMNNLNKGE